MSHYDIVKAKIKPHADQQDLVFQKFMLFLLDDPKYGSINQTKNQKAIKATQTIIDLYKEWIDTGKKPEQEIWLKAREVADAADAAYAAYAAVAAAVAAWAAASAADAAWAAADAADAAAYAGTPRSEVNKAQIEYLDHLINSNNLNIPNLPIYNLIGEEIIIALNKIGYSLIKTDELNRLENLSKKIKELV